MTCLTIRHPIDWGNHYHLILDYNTEHKILSGKITGPIGSTGIVEKHLIEMLIIEVAGTPHRINSSTTNHFIITTAEFPEQEFTIHLCLSGTGSVGGEVYGRIQIHAAEVKSHDILQKLTVFETRMLGNEIRYTLLPYSRQNIEPPALHTDLHTHSSGQISAQGLIEIALEHDIAYPTRLLDLLHITYPKENVRLTTRFFFPPTDVGQQGIIPREEDGVSLHALSEESREKLRAALSIPPDQQMTFGDLEVTIYRYRTPITKHPYVAYNLLLKTAQEYAKQGINYAEITATSASLLQPDYIAFLHEKLPEIEQKTAVKLRFLAGVPRNFPPEMLERETEKLQMMGASPYIVGIDFMGFEDNKITKLEPYIKTIAGWAESHDPYFTLRIHAGENRKNMENVKESLRLAEKYHMRVRIGHAAHGLDDDAIHIAQRLAKRGLVIIEFNPDSNMALNNIDTAEELNIVKCIDKNIPFVICSDGGGLFQTDATQLSIAASFAASFAGVGAGRLTSVCRSEDDHLKLEHQRFQTKRNALPIDFLRHIRIQYSALPPILMPEPLRVNNDTFEQKLRSHSIEFTQESIASATNGKKPLLILGASGERYWNIIKPEQKKQIHIGINAMLQQLDPRTMFFLIGRPKNEGITTLLSRAVQKYNLEHQDSERFSLISATVQADQTIHSFIPGLTHVIPIKGSLFNVPDQLVNIVMEAKGHILFIGGGTFVRDAILIARNKHVAFGLMKGPEGASTDKAVMMNKNRQFKDAEGLIDHLHSEHPDWFKSPKGIPLGLRIIGMLKIITSLLLAAATVGLFRLMNKDIGEALEHFVMRLHLDPENHWITTLLASIAGVDQSNLRALGVGSLCYAILYAIEGIGLLRGKHWAEYLVVIITGSLLPLELYEVDMKVSMLRISILIINIVIVAYLLIQLKRDRRPRV